MNFNALTLTLNNFITAFAGGNGRLLGIANGILVSLGAIDLVLLGFWWALGGGEQLTRVFKKILYLGFWIWAVRSFPTLAKSFVDTLVTAGTMAGGGGSGKNIMLDPSAIAGHGLDATAPLLRKIQTLSKFDLANIFVFDIAMLLIMLCFLVMAINCFITVLEYYLIVALVGLFLPFALFPSTKFLAEKAIGAVVSVGMKLMTLAFIMAVVEPTLANIHFASDEIAMNEIFAILLTAGGCTFLAWHAPRMAAGLMSGSPSLAAGDVAQHATVATGLAAYAMGALRGSRGASGARGSSGAAGSTTYGSASDLRPSSGAASGATPATSSGAAPAGASSKGAGVSLVRSLAPAPKPASPEPEPATSS